MISSELNSLSQSLSQKGIGNDNQGGMKNLLESLGDRVHNAIAEQDDQKQDQINPEAVKMMISGISQQPLPGMMFNTLV